MYFLYVVSIVPLRPYQAFGVFFKAQSQKLLPFKNAPSVYIYARIYNNVFKRDSVPTQIYGE